MMLKSGNRPLIFFSLPLSPLPFLPLFPSHFFAILPIFVCWGGGLSPAPAHWLHPCSQVRVKLKWIKQDRNMDCLNLSSTLITLILFHTFWWWQYESISSMTFVHCLLICTSLYKTIGWDGIGDTAVIMPVVLCYVHRKAIIIPLWWEYYGINYRFLLVIILWVLVF